MANEVQSRKQRAAQDILQGNIVTVTNVVKNHIDDFFLRLFQNALVSDVNNPSNKMMRNDQYATILYMECMTAVKLSPSKFSTVMNILNQYPLLRVTVEGMKAEGVEAGLMKAESDGMSTGTGAVVPRSETIHPTQTALPVQDKQSSSTQSLDAPCTDKYLAKLARSIQDWEIMAVDFDITDAEASTIKKDYSQQYELQKRKMLIIWKQKFGNNATYRRLVEIFESVGNKLLADLVREDFSQNQVETVGSVSSHQAAMLPATQPLATVSQPLPAHASSYTMPAQVSSSEERTLAQPVQIVSATAKSIKDIDFLEKVAEKLPAKWRMMGIALGVSSDQLDSISQRSPGDQTQCFQEVFDIWKNHPTVAPFSWVGVVQALQRNFVGEHALATKLMKEYSIQESFLKTSSLKDPPTLPDFMEQVATFIPTKHSKFGLVIGVKNEALIGFSALRWSDQLRCFESIFSDWEKGQPGAKPFKWSSVVTALKNVIVGENALARKIDGMLVQSSSVFFTHASPLMEELASTVLEITGGKHQTYKWHSNGFRLTVPAGAVPEGITISLTVRALLAGSFELPANSQLMSVIYWISATQCFHQDVTLYLQHCAVIKSKAQCAQFKFVAGKCLQPNFPYLLKMREGGVFTPHSQEASISVKQFSFYGIVCEGDEDIESFYCGQGFKKPEGQSWMLDYTITCYIESLLTWVQDKYQGQGWTQHHEQMLEFDETANESSQPIISLELTDPVSDEQKNWEVSFVSRIQFPKRVVDRITKKDHLPTSRIGIKWMGLPGEMHSPFARKIDLLGMKGPNNYFEIFLPEETGKEGSSETFSIHHQGTYCHQADFMNKVAVEIPASWYNFGISLGIDIGKLEGLGKIFPTDPLRCFSNIYSIWKQDSVQPLTWEVVVKILKSKLLANKALSLKIAAEYNL